MSEKPPNAMLQGERPTQLPGLLGFQLDGEWVGRSCGRQKERGSKQVREEVRKKK